MPAGFLGRHQVSARGRAFPFGRAPVGGHVAEAPLGRALVDFGGAFMGGGRLVVPMHRALMGRLVAFVGAVGMLGGALHVLVGDGLGGGEFRSPAQQLPGALAGFVAR